MIAFVRGKVVECLPAQVIIEAGGIGYMIHISLNTYSKIQGKSDLLLFTHQIIKEDGHYLYGFFEESERQLFILLLSVNGVGPNTARIILSSLEISSLKEAIQSSDDQVFRKVKGVGPKTAQRIIIDLRDKISKETLGSNTIGLVNTGNQNRNEALSALIALGFGRSQVEQVLKTFSNQEIKDQNLEDLIKNCLKKLS